MNKNIAIIRILIETLNQLEKEWEQAHEAQKASGEQDYKYYEEIKGMVNDTQNEVEKMIRDME